MKISYKWLCNYIKTDLNVHEVADTLTSIGLEVESVEKIESIPGGLKGVVVGEVITCEKHPDADRLRVTTVELGDGQPVQIVCGAPNVAAGQKVLVATIGTKLYPSSGEAMTIKKGKIRGQESNGMICAEDELGLGSSHDGIMVLDASAKPGTPAAELLNIQEDYCLEIGLTPNRTDAFSHIGVARDLYAAIRHMDNRAAREASMHYPSAPETKSGSIEFPVEVLDVEACKRYCSVSIRGVMAIPSPEWLQNYLKVIGQRPINFLVDITNFVQHEYGQPLHAFDSRQIRGGKVIVRKALPGEVFTTLDNIERTLHMDDLMICDAEGPMCIAGVFGGANSGVSESTDAVFLESAWFNPVAVRKTARRHGLHTDASFRFERGCDPTLTMKALNRAVSLILEQFPDAVVSGAADFYPNEIPAAQVRLNWNQATKLIGKDLGKDRIKAIVRDLDMEVIAENDQSIDLRIPHYRTDVTREADVVEEVLRIYGYDNVEIPQIMRTSLSASIKPDPEHLQNRVADMLASRGLNEMMSLSLTRRSYAEWMQGNEHNGSAVDIVNPLSNDLGMMRQSLIFGMLEAVRLNVNHRNSNLRAFEFGKVYGVNENRYQEKSMLAICVSGLNKPESWNQAKEEASFAELRSCAESIFTALNLQGLKWTSDEHPHYDDCIAVYVGKTLLGRLGSLSSDLLNRMDVSQKVWFADLEWQNILQSIPVKAVQYKEADKFPAVRRDLSLLLDKSVVYADIERLAFETERKLLRQVNLFDVYEGKNLEAGKKSYAISFVMQDSQSTMTDQQVDKVMGRIQKMLEEKLGASLRS